MGYLFNGRCFETQADATSAAYSVAPATLTGGGGVSQFEFVEGAWVVSRYDNTGLVSQYAAPGLSSASCDPVAIAADASALGWLVVAVWAGAWAINALRRALV